MLNAMYKCTYCNSYHSVWSTMHCSQHWKWLFQFHVQCTVHWTINCSLGSHVLRALCSRSLFYFVPQESHSQSGLASAIRPRKHCIVNCSTQSSTKCSREHWSGKHCTSLQCTMHWDISSFICDSRAHWFSKPPMCLPGPVKLHHIHYHHLQSAGG